MKPVKAAPPPSLSFPFNIPLSLPPVATFPNSFSTLFSCFFFFNFLWKKKLQVPSPCLQWMVVGFFFVCGCLPSHTLPLLASSLFLLSFFLFFAGALLVDGGVGLRGHHGLLAHGLQDSTLETARGKNRWRLPSGEKRVLKNLFFCFLVKFFWPVCLSPRRWPSWSLPRDPPRAAWGPRASRRCRPSGRGSHRPCRSTWRRGGERGKEKGAERPRVSQRMTQTP